MKATYFVNAMVMLESRHSRVLCDPWITFDETSDSGFFNFPATKLTRAAVAALKPDYLYITHTHPDHFDPTTLRLFDPATPVLIARYDLDFTRRSLAAVGFDDIRPAPRGEWLPLNGQDACWIEPSAANPEVDSVALFRLDGKVSVNANDNVFNRAQCERLRAAAGDVEVGFLPSGLHGPWPMFYDNLSPREKAQAAAEREARLKETFANYVEAFRPRFVVPYGGGLMCGGRKALNYRYSGIPARGDAVRHAQARCAFEPILLSCGNSFDFDSGQRRGSYVEHSLDSEAAYVARLAAKPSKFDPGGAFHVAAGERIDLSRLLGLARANMRKWQQRYGGAAAAATSCFFLDVGEARLYRLSLAEDGVARVAEGDIADPRYEIFRMPYELLLGLLTRHYVWSNVKTQQVDYYRKGEFDPSLLLLMNYLQI